MNDPEGRFLIAGAYIMSALALGLAVAALVLAIIR